MIVATFTNQWKSLPDDILKNPEKGDVESFARDRKLSWVKISIPLQNNVVIPALVKIAKKSRKVAFVRYPDDSREATWEKRRDGATKFAEGEGLRVAQGSASTSPVQPSPSTQPTPPVKVSPLLLVANGTLSLERYPKQNVIGPWTPRPESPEFQTDSEYVPNWSAAIGWFARFMRARRFRRQSRWTFLGAFALCLFVAVAMIVIVTAVKVPHGETRPLPVNITTTNQNQRSPKSLPPLPPPRKPAATDADTDDAIDPNAPKAVAVIHGDLKVTLACEPGNRQILCTGRITNIGNEDGDFYITGTDYPKHGWARDDEGDLARIVVDAGHFQLGDRTHWNNWHVWMPAKSSTRFWFSYESRNPDASKTAHIDLDMMWGGDNSLGFDISEVPINRTTYHSLDQ
jgi:hypothetical protein